MKGSMRSFGLLVLVCIWTGVSGLFNPRPPFDETVQVARWLVHEASWGIAATHSVDLPGYPFGGVVSFSDGRSPTQSTGLPFIYVTTLDATGRDIDEEGLASLTITEASLNVTSEESNCALLDPQDPTCASITLTGKFVRVEEEETEEALNALFFRHPIMQKWPKGHNFAPWKLEIEVIHFLDYYGGPKPIKLSDYLAATPY